MLLELLKIEDRLLDTVLQFDRDSSHDNYSQGVNKLVHDAIDSLNHSNKHFYEFECMNDICDVNVISRITNNVKYNISSAIITQTSKAHKDIYEHFTEMRQVISVLNSMVESHKIKLSNTLHYTIPRDTRRIQKFGNKFIVSQFKY